ncbi:hypothetical protein GIS00_12900 [Nakamurella sp. YIM 132087]|uniref:Fluoride-specific ion channel FluC n=1 Tax=Nakamurella alba TaxID=2665158 RepID=A0A7K1FLA2_9ACTN|nr:hypothetical protein [Nakamurella alba]
MVEPVDADVDLRDPRQRAELRRRHGSVLGAVALGGAVGALARYGIGLLWPAAPGTIPWDVLVINVSGSLLIGVLMVLVVERPGAHRLLRPLLGTGVLGGYTTFSTYALDVHRLVEGGHPGAAAGYLVGTLAGALFGTWAGLVLTRRAVGHR